MIIDTEIYKTEKEISEMLGKTPPSINRSIKRHEARTGIELSHILAFGVKLYNIHSLPKAVTEKRETGEAPKGSGNKQKKE